MSSSHFETWIAQYGRMPLRVIALHDADDGHDPLSVYVETFWLPVVGPTSLAVARRLAVWLTAEPDGFDLDLAELAVLMGVGQGTSRNSAIVRTLSRTLNFDLTRRIERDETYVLGARTTFPIVPPRHVRRWPDVLIGAHAAYEMGAM